MSIIAAVLIFGVLILVHESGHFLAARLCGVNVLEFSIGMGPRIMSKQGKHTLYSLRLLPFGGSCMMEGEDTADTSEGAFFGKSVWQRICVIAAGPVFNLVFAFLAALVVAGMAGHDYARVAECMEGFPAAESGIEAGDLVADVDGHRVNSRRDLSGYIYMHPGKELHLGLISANDKERYETDLTPVYSEEHGAYLLGLVFEGYRKAESLPELFSYGAYELGYCLSQTVDGLRMLAGGTVAAKDAVAGPVRIVSMVGQSIGESSEDGVSSVVYAVAAWVMMLGASLGFMNLLPLPALDGGRLFFLFIELLRGKPADQKLEGMVHLAGFMLLMALMVVIFFNDLRNLL